MMYGGVTKVDTGLKSYCLRVSSIVVRCVARRQAVLYTLGQLPFRRVTRKKSCRLLSTMFGALQLTAAALPLTERRELVFN
jgi:hypothetical protein